MRYKSEHVPQSALCFTGSLGTAPAANLRLNERSDLLGTTGPASYWHPDWLGTSRLESTPSRTVAADAAFAPFGEQYASGTQFDSVFTGVAPHDKAADLSDFSAREYHPTQGRWLSPDPAGLAAVDITDPQTWNRYAYVRNNPLALIDPTGLNIELIGNCLYSTTYFYVDGQYDSSDTQRIFCFQPGGSGGSSGGGGGAVGGQPTGLGQKIRQAYCSAVPEASTLGLTGSVGIIGGQVGTLEMVTNYDTGEQSLFASGGAQFGLPSTGGASGGVMFGFIQGLAGSNANYKGPFSNMSGSIGPFGATLSASSQGWNGPLKFSSPTAATLSITGSLLPVPYTAAGSVTYYSNPLGMGNLRAQASPIPGKALFDLALYVLRRPCN